MQTGAPSFSPTAAAWQPPQRPLTVLFFSNNVAEDGFGRIANQLAAGLQRRGYQVGAASISATHVPWNWPYQVWALNGHDLWGELQQCIGSLQPDVIVVCQDWPYLTTAALLPRIDWSQHALIGITPTDGVPIYQEWLDAVPRFDALFTISRFGVQAFQQAGTKDRWGQAVGLLLPGVDQSAFYPAPPEERAYLRQQAGIPQDAYMLGAWMANQGRKCWPEVLQLFGRYRVHQPDALLVCDADRISPAGWNLPILAKQIAETEHLPPFAEGIRYRDQLAARGLATVRQRMVICDIGLQMAYREGYGLPIAELQASGVLTLAQQYCSGTELCGDGRGLVCRSRPYGRYGTWGNAKDFDPDVDHALELLLDVRQHPAKAAAIVEHALECVRQENWDQQADLMDQAIKRIVRLRAQQRAIYQAAHPLPGQAPVTVPAMAPPPSPKVPPGSAGPFARSPAEAAEMIASARLLEALAASGITPSDLALPLAPPLNGSAS